jgi:hypothetical protein
MAKHKKDEQSCTLMNILFMIGGLILGILIGTFIIPYLFGETDITSIGSDNNYSQIQSYESIPQPNMQLTPSPMVQATPSPMVQAAPSTMVQATPSTMMQTTPQQGMTLKGGSKRLFKNKFK